MTKFRHYRGGEYQLVCIARLEADPDINMVVYQGVDGTIWTRPESVFFEMVEFEGRQVPRFELLGSRN